MVVKVWKRCYWRINTIYIVLVHLYSRTISMAVPNSINLNVTYIQHLCLGAVKTFLRSARSSYPISMQAAPVVRPHLMEQSSGLITSLETPTHPRDVQYFSSIKTCVPPPIGRIIHFTFSVYSFHNGNGHWMASMQSTVVAIFIMQYYAVLILTEATPAKERNARLLLMYCYFSGMISNIPFFKSKYFLQTYWIRQVDLYRLCERNTVCVPLSLIFYFNNIFICI